MSLKLVLELTGRLGRPRPGNWQQRPLSRCRSVTRPTTALPACRAQGVVARLAAAGNTAAPRNAPPGAAVETHYLRARSAHCRRARAALKTDAWRDAAALGRTSRRALSQDDVMVELARERQEHSPISQQSQPAQGDRRRIRCRHRGGSGKACALAAEDLPAPEPALSADRSRADALLALCSSSAAASLIGLGQAART
jgi:hypothetical protein